MVEMQLRQGHLVTTAVKVLHSTDASQLCKKISQNTLASLLRSLSWKLKLYSAFCKEGGSATPQLKPKHRQFITECFM